LPRWGVPEGVMPVKKRMELITEKFLLQGKWG
jgi:hypothetical protein